MTAAQCGGSTLAMRFTTVVLPEPEPPAIPMMIIVIVPLVATKLVFFFQTTTFCSRKNKNLRKSLCIPKNNRTFAAQSEKMIVF